MYLNHDEFVPLNHPHAIPSPTSTTHPSHRSPSCVLRRAPPVLLDPVVGLGFAASPVCLVPGDRRRHTQPPPPPHLSLAAVASPKWWPWFPWASHRRPPPLRLAPPRAHAREEKNLIKSNGILSIPKYKNLGPNRTFSSLSRFVVLGNVSSNHRFLYFWDISS